MKRHSRGFTLIELMVTLIIVAIITLIGTPSFNDAIRRSRLTTSINELVTSLNIARSEAIKRNRSVTVRKNDDLPWEGGWNIFVDMNGDGTLDNDGDCAEGHDCVLKIQEALPSGYTLRPNNTAFNNYIRYKPNGMSSAGMVSFILCDASSNTPQSGAIRVLILNTIGRPRMAIDANKNGIPEDSDGVEISSCSVK